MGKRNMIVVIKNNKETKIFANEKEVEEYIRRENGNYYIINVYPALVTVEQYQIYQKKAYRINAINT